MCAVIAFTPQATYVGPGEIESKLEAINLTFAVPSDLVWSRIHIQCRCSISTDAASICDPISVTGTASEMTAIVAVTRVAPIIPRLCK